MSKMLKQAAEGTFLLTIAQIVGRFMNFVYYILLLAAFKPAILGLFFLLVSILNFFKSFINSIMGSSFIRYIPEYAAEKAGDKIAATQRLWATVSIAVVVIGTVVSFLMVEFIYPQLKPFVFFAPFYLLVSFGQGFMSNLAVSFRDFKVRTMLELIQTTAATLLLAAVIYDLHMISVYGLFLVSIASSAFSVFAGLVFLRKRISLLFRNVSTAVISGVFDEQWRYSIANMLYQNINAFMINADMLILGVFSTPAIIGVYGMIKRIFTAIGTFTLVPVQSVVLPSLSYVLGKGKDVRSWVLKSLKWFFGFSVLMAVGFTLMAQLIFNLFFKAYANYMWLSYIFFLVPVVRSIKVSMGNYFRLRNQMDVLVKIGVVALVLNVVLDLLLIKVVGVVGVVLATVVSELFVAVAVVEKFDSNFLPTLKHIHLEFIVWGLFCLLMFFFIKVPFRSVVFATIFTLGMIALMLRAMDEDEKQLFESYLKKLALFFHH